MNNITPESEPIKPNDSKIPDAEPIPSATPPPIAKPSPIAEKPKIAERPFANKIEGTEDRNQREFLTIIQEVQHCGVELPDPSDTENYYAELAEKTVDDINLAHEIANAINGLRTISRAILARAKELNEKAAALKPDAKKATENRAIMMALDAAIIEHSARVTEERLAASVKIIDKKVESGEDAKNEVRFFANQARNTKISGMYEKFKYDVKRALSNY